MTRTMIPFAASALLALVGLPAAAAQLGDEDAAASSTTASSSSSLDGPAEATVQAARAASRGGARGGARGGSHAAPARAAHGAPPHGAPGHAVPPRAASGHAVAPLGAPPHAAPPAHAAPAHAGSAGAQSHARPPQAHPPQAGPHAPNVAHPGPHAPPPAAHAPAHPAPHPPSAGHRRPGAGPVRHVVHHPAGLPPRWSPAYHRYTLRGVPHWQPRYWSAGVFVYNAPPPRRHVVVVDGSGQRVMSADEPARAVDRNHSLSVGLRGGSYISGYEDGGSYGDLGMGLALRYRPVESVGLEMSWMHHSDTWDNHQERAQDPLSASVQLFAFPWTRVSPYASVGLTATPRATEDRYFNGLENVTYTANDALFGPHLGLGIEFAVGQKASLGFEGRYIGYIDRQPNDAAFPGAFQGSMGLNMYF